ncbi:MAG: DUF58 domain-containing protein [Myxococcales bacterium]|jgi:uncharacterized protein (DUF58 family)|nr:DUF58 domain-containing protein [Myxococcales bacterium]
MTQKLRTAIDWGTLAPLRMRARLVAEGVYAGSHRSARRGAGVEFGGHRPYVPGDDLRWLDRRSLLRHEHLLVREFETETDRALRLCIDATASMSYRGARAPGSKLAFAALVAAALGRVAITGGDPVGCSFIGGTQRPLPVSSGRESFERLVGTLEALEATGDTSRESELLDAGVGAIARAARRGSAVVVLSDLLDLGDGAKDAISSIAMKGRVLVVLEVLDPDELDFPFEDSTRLASLEGDYQVDTDGDARERYLEALGAARDGWERALLARGARLVRSKTTDDPVVVVRAVLDALR